MSTARGKIQRRSVTGDSAPFDIPPPKFGRYRVQHQIGVGATGPVFRSEDPDTHSPLVIKALRTDLSPDGNQKVVDDLIALIDRLPSHPGIAPLRDAGLEDQKPFLVSDLLPGEGLDVALKKYGPGAIVDLLPRLRSLAEALDVAAERDLCHGAIHPRDVIISDATYLNGIGVAAILMKRGFSVPSRRPYTAPEIWRAEAPTRASDQFALAALAFEWLFGNPIAGPAYTPMEVPALPDVRSQQLSDAFTTALASEPSARFASCSAFVDAMSAALPALATQPVSDRFLDVPLKLGSEAAFSWDDDDSLDTPLIGEHDTGFAARQTSGVVSPSMFTAESKPQRSFGLGALAATLFLGMGVGLVAGYVASARLWPMSSGSCVLLQRPILSDQLPSALRRSSRWLAGTRREPKWQSRQLCLRPKPRAPLPRPRQTCRGRPGQRGIHSDRARSHLQRHRKLRPGLRHGRRQVLSPRTNRQHQTRAA